MKRATDENLYLIDRETTFIPDVGLGAFVKGYSDRRTPFPWKLLLWFLFPFVGWLMFIIFFSPYLAKKLIRYQENMYIYSNGFYRFSTYGNNKLIKRSLMIINFDDIIAINFPKMRHYTYGIYGRTNFSVLCLDSQKNDQLLWQGWYKNENEKEGKYNFKGYVALALMEAWNSIAIERHIRELKQKGYTLFYYFSSTRFEKFLVEVQLSPEFIRVNENYIDNRNFSYQIFNGFLYIYPSKELNKKQFTININGMYDSSIFLFLLQKYWGVG